MHSRTKQGVQKLRCMGIDTSVITKCADISNSQAFPCTQIGKWGGGDYSQTVAFYISYVRFECFNHNKCMKYVPSQIIIKKSTHPQEPIFQVESSEPFSGC